MSKKPKKKKQEVTVGEIAKQFLAWVGVNRSANTFKMYDNRLRPFIEQFGTAVVRQLKPQQIDDYFAGVNKWVDGKEKAPDTIRANIVALEQLEKFAIKKQLIKKPFVGEHEKPAGRMRDRLPTADEVSQIKAIASPEFNVVYQALRQSGARPNEIARATVADWDRVTGQIVLEKHKTARKTGRPRKIAVGEKLAALILASLGDRTEGPLFRTPRGNQWTTDTLSQTFSRYRNAAGVDKAVVLYSSRHEHATAICKLHGMDATADALGHATKITGRYVHQDPKERQARQDSVSL